MKRGRKSAEDRLTLVRLSDARLTAPSHLASEERAEWESIVNSLPADYFRPSDVQLLGAYCQAAAFYKQAAANMRQDGLYLLDERGKRYVNPAHAVLTSQASSMAQMAVKLRLCPSSRYSEKTAATRVGDSAKPTRPWETGEAAEG